MQNIEFIDNQLVTWCMVQMWFKLSGINFHVAGTKRTWILFSEILGNNSVKFRKYLTFLLYSNHPNG